jgi:biotin carboxyl carrier protein
MSKPVSVIWPNVAGVLREWKVSPSQFVKQSQPLAVCEPLNLSLLAPKSGIVKSFLFKKGDAISASCVDPWRKMLIRFLALL